MSPRAALRVLLLVSAPFLLCRNASAQDTEADSAAVQPVIEEGVDYIVYDRQGRRASARSIVSAAMGADVLLIGEEHDDMVGHAFQTLIFNTVLEEVGPVSGSGRAVVLSLEMFERDVQYVLDEYLDGQISEDHFLKSSRPWGDYEARYRPAVESAREHGASIVAANAPRRYVSRVTAHGPESLMALSAQARSYLPPLPYPGPSRVYREQWEALMTAAMMGVEDGEGESDGNSDGTDNPDAVEGDGADADADGEDDDAGGDDAAQSARYGMTPYAIYSQALWDASMGHAITEALVRHVGGFVVHFAGSFHVAKGTGIVERIADYRPGTRVTTVVMTKVDDIEAWSADEHAELADYVVLTQKPEAQEH